MNKTTDKYAALPTEQQNPRTMDLDRIPLRRVIEKINREDAAITGIVAKVIPQIEKAARFAGRTYAAGGSIIFVGAGTSGRMGVLEAAECPPTFGVTVDDVKAIMAGGESSVFRAKEGAEDDAEMGARDTLRQIKPGDCVIGIAASGVTPYVMGAIKAARSKKCKTVLVTCNNKPAKSGADVVIAPVTGPEALSGSTRMKAGTATKMVLNYISTAAMVSVGKAYHNWMVDVRATNKKLRARALRLVSTIGQVPADKAQQLLEQTNYNVKASIVMARRGVDFAQAQKLIKKANGFLKDVIE